MYFSHYTAGRDNNFNLVRFIAALLVLISHSFALATGSREAEPLREALGTTWGTIAVDAFFVTSGFLVTGSLLARKNLTQFFLARFLRIYPGLWVALILTVTASGLFFTTLRWSDFFLHAETWKYIITNGSLLKASYFLPGVFEDLPRKGVINGSLWTLPLEIRMYCALAVLWFVARIFRGNIISNFAKACIAIAAIGAVLNMLTVVTDTRKEYISLGYMFFAGATLRILQDRVIVSSRLAGLMFLAIIISSLDKTTFGIIYSLCTPYLVIFLALVPAGLIRRFNRFGDYSYGIYIYAFPVQQMTAFFWRGIDPYEMIILSLIITLMLAIASWELIEKRALALKRSSEENRYTRPPQSEMP